MANVLDFGLEINEFKLQSGSYIHFRTNTLEEGMYPLMPPNYRLNSITDFFLQGWLYH